MIRIDKKNLQFRLGALILAVLGMTLASLAAFQGFDLQLHIDQRLNSPSAAHPFGTDALGRDMLSCLASGTWVSLAIGLAAVFLAALIGAGLGFLAGWHGGPLNACIMRCADFILAFEELEALRQVLPQAVEVLKPGGRLCVISFHSLEDRIVKQFMQEKAQDCVCPPSFPVCVCDHRAQLKMVQRRPIVASQAESDLNPRARSARLRVAARI